MKHSQLIGILACIALICACFMPWSFIISKQISITGFHTEGTNFGKPGYATIFFSLLMALLFVIPKIWSKRCNVFVAAFNLAWALRNYLLVTTCEGGECPEKKAGIYLLIILSIIILLMTFFPRMKEMNK